MHDRRSEFTMPMTGAIPGEIVHSPPERENQSGFDGAGNFPPSYVNTEERSTTINVGVHSSKRQGNERYFMMSYENTLSDEESAVALPIAGTPNIIH